MALPEGIQSIGELEGYARITSATLYLAVATGFLVIYEYFITLDMEIAYIWTSLPRVNFTKIIFVINRYYPIIRVVVHLSQLLPESHSLNTCTRFTDFNSWSTLLNVATVEVLMLLRAWAVWNQSRSVAFVLILAFLMAIAGCAFINEFVPFPNIPGVVSLPPESVWLCERAAPSKYVAQYSIGLALEMVSFVFLFCRVLWMTWGVEKGKEVPILQALRLQGTWYFACVISAMGLSIGAGFNEKLALPILYSGIVPTVSSIVATRIILALRGMYLDPDSTIETNEGPGWGSPDLWGDDWHPGQGATGSSMSSQSRSESTWRKGSRKDANLDFILPKLDSTFSSKAASEMWISQSDISTSTGGDFVSLSDLEKGTDSFSEAEYVTANAASRPTLSVLQGSRSQSVSLSLSSGRWITAPPSQSHGHEGLLEDSSGLGTQVRRLRDVETPRRYSSGRITQ